jgi:hypothetical protein
LALYADDTVIYSSSKSPLLLIKYTQSYFNLFEDWLTTCKVTVNPLKSHSILISKKRKKRVLQDSFLFYDSPLLEITKSTLGSIIETNLNRWNHIDIWLKKLEILHMLYVRLYAKVSLTLIKNYLFIKLFQDGEELCVSSLGSSLAST